MTITRAVMTLMAGTLFAATTQAADLPAPQPYIGVGIGAAKTKDIHNQMVDLAQAPGFNASAVESDDGGAAFKLYLGIQASENVDLQLSYVNFGKIESTLKNLSVNGTPVGDTTASVELQGVTLAPVLKLPLTPALELFGKVGISYFSGKTKVDAQNLSISESDTGTAFSFGGGVSYRHGNIAALLEYERYQEVMEDTNFNFTSLGLRYYF